MVEVDLNALQCASSPSLIAGLRSLGLFYDEVGVAMAKIRIDAIFTPKSRPQKSIHTRPQLSAAGRLRLIISGGVTQKK
jgi:hypothetical protein